jgi:hypothetical protein
MDEVILSLKGVNGQLELYSGKVIIKRKGALAKMTQGFFKGDKTIYLKQITGIQFKPGGAFTNGYIQFTVPGGIESRKGIIDATKDENTVMFNKKDNELVNEIKLKIEELQSLTNGNVPTNQLSAADEIKKYKALLDEGIITQEDYDAKKKQLLNL